MMDWIVMGAAIVLVGLTATSFAELKLQAAMIADKANVVAVEGPKDG
ncbi:MAG: hypothetical protein AAFS07_10445 [Pseudomonadota bacterium]